MQILSNDSYPKDQRSGFQKGDGTSRFSSLFNVCVRGVGAAAQTASWVALKAADYTVKPAAQAIVKNTVGRVADKVVSSYKNDNEKYLSEVTGNGELVAFIHDICRQFPFLDKTFLKNIEKGSATSEEIQTQIIIHILATFAKKENVTCSGPELLGRFLSFIETTYENVVRRSIDDNVDFAECATAIFEEIFPELNNGWLFGYPASFAASFLSDLHKAHGAAENTSPKEAEFIPFIRKKLHEAKSDLSDKSTQEKLVSHAIAFVPGASSDFMAETVRVLLKSTEKSHVIEDVPEPLQLLISQFPLLENVAARFVARIIDQIKASDYTFLTPFSQAPVEKWPALLKAPCIAYLREEKAVPGFLRNAILGYIEANFESLLLGKYKNQLIKAKRALDAEWGTLINNPLKGTPHEEKARAVARNISAFLLPKNLQGLNAPFEELFLQVIAKNYKEGDEFGAILNQCKEKLLLDIRHLHDKFLINRTLSLGDVKKVLDRISPSIAILYPQSISIVHGHLMKSMGLTQGLSKTEAASPHVKDLSFLLDLAIKALQEKHIPLLDGIQLGDTIEPLLVGLKQGLLRLMIQISAKNDLTSSLIALSDLADLYQQRNEGYEVNHLIAMKLDALGIDDQEIEWLLTAVWPHLKNSVLPIVNVAKSQKTGAVIDARSKLFANDFAKFLASKIPFSGISEETKIFFIEKGVLSMLMAIDPEGTLAPLERIDRLSEKWISLINKPKEMESVFAELCPLLAPYSATIVKALIPSDIIAFTESLQDGVPTSSFDRFMQKKGSQPFSELCSSLVDFATRQIVASWGSMLATSGAAKGHLFRAVQKNTASIETLVKALIEKVALSLIERGEKRDPSCDSLLVLLVLGLESLVEEIQCLLPVKEDSEVEQQQKIDKILTLVIGDLAKKLPDSLRAIISSHIDSFLSVVTLWNSQKAKNIESIDSKFSSNNFSYFIDKLSNSWLVGFIPHILKANAATFSDSLAKTLHLQNSEGLKTLLLLLAEKMATVSDSQEMSPLRGLLIFFCSYAEGALLKLFSNLFTLIHNEDKIKEMDGGFLFHLMSQGVEKASHFYEGVFEVGKDLMGRTSDANILDSLRKRNVHHKAQLSLESRDEFYRDISKKLVFATGLPEEEEVAMPKAFLQPSIEFLATTLLPIVFKSIENNTMSQDALDGFAALLVDKLDEAVRNWKNSESNSTGLQAEPILPPGIKKGDLGKVVRNLIRLVPTLAVAPLLELDEISQMTDERLDAVFISLFHGTDFFTFISPMVEGLIPVLIGVELVKKNEHGYSSVHIERKDGKPIAPAFEEIDPVAQAASRAAKQQKIKRQVAALLIRGTEKIINDKAASVWSSIEYVFKKIWSYISSAVGTILGEFTGTVSKHVEASRFKEPIRKVGDAIWAFIDYVFSGIILKVLQLVAVVPYWIFKSLMTLYLERKVSVYLDELHRPHHRGVFYHFIEEVIEAIPGPAAA